MKRCAAHPLRYLTALTLLLSAAHLAFADSEAETRAKLSQLKTRLQQVEKQLSEIRGLHGGVLQKLRNAEKHIGDIQNRSRELRKQQQQLNERLQQFAVERSSIHSRLDQQRELIGRQVRLAYQLGRQSKLKLLLNQQNPAQLTRTLTWYDYFNRARTDLVGAWLNDLASLERVERDTAITRDSLKTAEQALLKQQAQLEQQVAARRQVIAKLDANHKTAEAKRARWQREERELQALLRTLLEEIADLQMPDNQSQPFAQRKRQMQWPVAGPRLNAFGGARSGSGQRWDGIRIAAKAGAGVKAIHSGRVVFSDWLKGSGLLMILDHGNGYMSLYANNESLLHTTGDWVETGQLIATVGNSGGRQDSGLYFEIRRNGDPVDPVIWCARG